MNNCREMLQKGIALLQARDSAGAEKCFLDVLAGDPGTSSVAAAYLGSIALQRRDVQAALKWSRRCSQLDPRNPNGPLVAALACMASGDVKGAGKWCRKALEIERDFIQAHTLLAQISMPGSSYYEVLAAIHRYLQPANYLEIGVCTGESLQFALDDTRVVGVDPAPMLKAPLKSNARLYTMTSDEFFAAGKLALEFGAAPVDLAFVDGMHLFEYALRDFINIEKAGSRQTVVLFHDCYPLDEVTAQRNRQTRFWTGDVWKVIVCLKKYRPDLKIHVIKARPSGLGIVTGLDPGNAVLHNNLDKVVDEFAELGFDCLSRDPDGTLNAVDNSWLTVKQLLDGRFC